MSAEFIQVLSLFSRYLFVLLGILIALWSFLWLLSDRRERRRRIHALPNAGLIGEFVVVSGSRELPEGRSIPVPWEGILGSVRTADLCVPCGGVQRSHLAFSFEPGQGLLICPLSGREALVNGVALNCHSHPERTPLSHGSYLQVGNALLRLRIFAGLDPSAGFDDPETGNNTSAVPQAWAGPPRGFSGYAVPGMPNDSAQGVPDYPASPMVIENPPYFPDNSAPQIPPSDGYMAIVSPDAAAPQASPPEDFMTEASSAGRPVRPARRRRADRWEVDWSE